MIDLLVMGKMQLKAIQKNKKDLERKRKSNMLYFEEEVDALSEYIRYSRQ